jgi:hypothetical protein
MKSQPVDPMMNQPERRNKDNMTEEKKETKERTNKKEGKEIKYRKEEIYRGKRRKKMDA